MSDADRVRIGNQSGIAADDPVTACGTRAARRRRKAALVRWSVRQRRVSPRARGPRCAGSRGGSIDCRVGLGGASIGCVGLTAGKAKPKKATTDFRAGRPVFRSGLDVHKHSGLEHVVADR